MALTPYRKGSDKERRIVNAERRRGNLAFRSAGSHSPIDVFVLNPIAKVIYLIQSKPRSISQNQKNKILVDIKKFEGEYKVIASVE
jgi:Holliday junction resolvase